MYQKGLRGEHFSKKDLTHYKKFKSYKDLITSEFPKQERLDEEELKKKEKKYKKLSKYSRYNKGWEKETFRTLENELIMHYLLRIPEFKKLQQLLRKPDKNFPEIVKIIRLIRFEIMKNELFKHEQREIVKTPEEHKKLFKKIKKELKDEPGDITEPKYKKENIKIKKLYHWVPEYLYDIIKEQGLIPGFLSGSNLKFFTYTSLERNEFWPQKLQYPRAEGKKNNKFIELEIKYTPEIIAHLWLAFYSDSLYRTYYPLALLSTEVVSLDKQVSEMINYDNKKAIDLREPHYFSSLQQKLINYYNKASISKYEYSEVLIDYIPPSSIKKIGEKTIKRKK